MKNKNGGFISFLFMVLIVIVILVVLRYRYDFDVIDKAFKIGTELWQKYGGLFTKTVNSIKK